MNEKLKELAEQAGIFKDFAVTGMWLADDQELERFAELIVRECVIRAEREWIRNGLHTEHNQAVSKVIESIKQHFGVEE